MKNIKGELVRIKTEDDLELHGIFFEPEKRTENVLIHVHAWVGNFYENKFIDFIAQEMVKKNIAFLSCNNRGTGFVTNLIKRFEKKIEYERIGGSLEKFEDSIKDIKAYIDFLSRRGYKNIILEGHSTGCQKITYYESKTRDKKIKGLIELSPADDVAVSKILLGDKYSKAIEIAKKMVKEGKDTEPVPEWMSFYPLLSAKTFLTITDPESSSGRIFYYSGGLKEIKNVNCPVLVIFGSEDKYEASPQKKLQILKNKVKNCSVKLIEAADHWFTGHEEELKDSISSWTEKIILRD